VYCVLCPLYFVFFVHLFVQYMYVCLFVSVLPYVVNKDEYWEIQKVPNGHKSVAHTDSPNGGTGKTCFGGGMHCPSVSNYPCIKGPCTNCILSLVHTTHVDEPTRDVIRCRCETD